ncbi:hypothetical protein B5X24_HaOG214896 [Helicoverpa armigera]|uniref:Uncharacterized protein n=1 Tax=Helicoverpa armigera TaxID=29058 RepID=A0A2W1BBT4_HELAM|nr:hypothetical protein B5X24_HaOG214896 [Helicoverpa armigera]
MEQYGEVEKALGTNIEDFDAAELEEELQELLAGPGGTGGTPGKEERREAAKLPVTPSPAPGRKISEREFVFDGEARMLAELELLDDDDRQADAAPATKSKPVAIAEAVPTPTATKPKPSQPWYPAAGEGVRGNAWSANNNVDIAGFGELRQDDRLHPGQQLNVDFTRPPRLYNSDFQVQDHKLDGGVWLYTKDSNSNVDSTDYFSAESPGKSTTATGFQMAPGGERRKSTTEPSSKDSVDDLQRRLDNLRGFNL